MKQCPACSRKNGLKQKEAGIYECPKCGCIFGQCYLGESYKYVLPYWTEDRVPDERIRPYDFLCLGSEGITRRHGFYDTQTRRIVQSG